MTGRYQKMLRKRPGQITFQLGDMGVGFKTKRGNPASPRGGLHKDIMSNGNHRWIRGNHDNPEVARGLTDKGYAGDYGYDPTLSLFWCGGAFSYDAAYRVPGVDWWHDEELSYSELLKVIDLYVETKPRIVATHEAPAQVGAYLLERYKFRDDQEEKAKSASSRTASAFQQMLDQHQPAEWVFGHYHVDQSFVWRGTKFTCVNELSVYTVSDEPLIKMSWNLEKRK